MMKRLALLLALAGGMMTHAYGQTFPGFPSDAMLCIGQAAGMCQWKGVSGDVAVADTGAVTIGAGAVTGSKIASGTIANSNLANIAAKTLKGSVAGGTPADLTPQQVQTVLAATQCLNITSSAFGGVGDNTTDNTAALNAALAALTGNGGCVYFPPGKYKFNSAITYNLPAGIFSVALIGAGQDSTILTWPAASGGITFNYAGISSSVHIRDLSLTTGTTAGGNAVTLNYATLNSNPANTAISDFYRVTIRGDDGYAATDYWSVGANIVNVPNVQFENVGIFGSGTSQGTGVNLVGLVASSTFGVQYNVTKSTLQNLNTGILYGSFIQGLAVDQTNFTFDVNGIGSAASETGALDQLSVTNSQFNPATAANGNGIIANTAIGSVQIANSLFLNGGASQSCINLVQAKHFAITNNEMQGIGSSSSNCIIIGTTQSSSPGVIAGNDIFGFGTGGAGIWLQAASTLVNVYGNVFTANATNIVNSGTSNVITNNLGYNPVGPAGITVTASPFTYTAGSSPETIYIFGGTVSQVNVDKNGGALTTIACGASPCAVDLGPFEQTKVTYTVAPNMNKMVH